MPNFKDFYDMPIPQTALDLGFVDRSWHNDAGPRMIHISQQAQDDWNDVDGTGTPILTFMCGGEHQAQELGKGHGYLVYWSVYGCEPASDRPTFCTDNLDDALLFLALQRDVLLFEQQAP